MSAKPQFELVVVTSLDGYVYCVHDTRRQVAWTNSLGAPISQSPIVIQDAVGAITDEYLVYR